MIENILFIILKNLSFIVKSETFANSENINVPVDLIKFLFDYKHSKFVECNREYAKDSLNRMKGDYSADEQQIKIARHGIVYVTSIIESFQKNYWLAAGTLLGNLSKIFILNQLIDNY